jgi:hypothetical protein
VNHQEFLWKLKRTFKLLDEYDIPITDELYSILMHMYTDFKLSDSIKDSSVDMSVRLFEENTRLFNENTQLKKDLHKIITENPHLMEFYEDKRC